MAQVGSLVYGGLIAAAVTGLYAWIMYSDWEPVSYTHLTLPTNSRV